MTGAHHGVGGGMGGAGTRCHGVLEAAYVATSQATLLAHPVAVEFVVALGHVLAHLLVHGELVAVCHHDASTAGIVHVTEAALTLHGGCLGALVLIVVVCIIGCKGGSCAEDHHSDYHQALECSLHNRIVFSVWLNICFGCCKGRPFWASGIRKIYIPTGDFP